MVTQVDTLHLPDAYCGGADQFAGLKNGPLLDLSVSSTSPFSGGGSYDHRSQKIIVVKTFISPTSPTHLLYAYWPDRFQVFSIRG
ncbi:hypothetical protein [Nitrospira sp. Ecomares 2.1]